MPEKVLRGVAGGIWWDPPPPPVFTKVYHLAVNWKELLIAISRCWFNSFTMMHFKHGPGNSTFASVCLALSGVLGMLPTGWYRTFSNPESRYFLQPKDKSGLFSDTVQLHRGRAITRIRTKVPGNIARDSKTQPWLERKKSEPNEWEEMEFAIGKWKKKRQRWKFGSRCFFFLFTKSLKHIRQTNDFPICWEFECCSMIEKWSAWLLSTDGNIVMETRFVLILCEGFDYKLEQDSLLFSILWC